VITWERQQTSAGESKDYSKIESVFLLFLNLVCACAYVCGCMCVCSYRERAIDLTPTIMKIASPALLPSGTRCKTLRRDR